MLSNIRAFAKSPFAILLFALLVISFAVFGITDVFQGGAVGDSVIQAGRRQVTSMQFKQTFDNYRRQLEQQNQGRSISVEEAVNAGLDRQMLEGLAYSESLSALITRMGVVPSDRLVVEEIRKSPAFFDQISGRFDRATYQARLRENGLTEADFERALRDDIAQSHLVTGIAAGLQAPRTYAAALAAFNREGRSFRWFAVNPASIQPPEFPTDEQLNDFLRQNAERFTKPEMRRLTLVRFSTAQIAPTIAVDEAEVQRRFEFERDSLSTPERRTLVQIPARDAAAAAEAVRRLRANEDPAAVARALGVEPVVYTDAPRTAIADRAIADAVFSLSAGEVSEPLQGSLGLAVVKVQSITPGHEATLQEVRPRIVEAVRRDAAMEQVYDVVQKYEDARSSGSNMAEAARAAGVTLVPVEAPVTADGMDLDGRQSNLPPQVLQTAFGLPATGESEVEDAGQGEYYAVRVDEIMPAALATLDEIRPLATQAYMFEEFRRRLQARADELAGRIREGEAMDRVAASASSRVQQVPDLRRDGAGQEFGRQLLGALFGAKKDETVVAQDDRLGVVIAQIDDVVTGAPDELAPLAQAQREGLRNNLFGDIGFAARNAARDAIKPRIDLARARAALGLDPLTAPATAPAPGGSGQ